MLRIDILIFSRVAALCFTCRFPCHALVSVTFCHHEHSGLYELCHCHRHSQPRAASAARVLRRPFARFDDRAVRVEHSGMVRRNATIECTE